MKLRLAGLVTTIWMGLLASSALADGTTISVTLWDNGADKEMVTDLGMSGSGDHTMANMGIKLSQDAVKAGEVTFELTNASKETVHEMLVIPLQGDEPPPFNAEDNEVNEDTAGALGEIEETEPGKTGSATFNLVAGKYLLVCNIAGHYANGMWVVLTAQ